MQPHPPSKPPRPPNYKLNPSRNNALEKATDQLLSLFTPSKKPLDTSNWLPTCNDIKVEFSRPTSLFAFHQEYDSEEEEDDDDERDGMKNAVDAFLDDLIDAVDNPSNSPPINPKLKFGRIDELGNFSNGLGLEKLSNPGQSQKRSKKDKAQHKSKNFARLLLLSVQRDLCQNGKFSNSSSSSSSSSLPPSSPPHHRQDLRDGHHRRSRSTNLHYEQKYQNSFSISQHNSNHSHPRPTASLRILPVPVNPSYTTHPKSDRRSVRRSDRRDTIARQRRLSDPINRLRADSNTGGNEQDFSHGLPQTFPPKRHSRRRRIQWGLPDGI